MTSYPEPEPMTGVVVTVYKISVAADGTRTWTSVAKGDTNAQGGYQVGVPAGTYRLGYQAGSVFEPRYYQDATAIDSARNVVVEAGSTELLDPVKMVRLDGRLTGRLLNADQTVFTGSGTIRLVHEVSERDATTGAIRTSWSMLPEVELDDGIFSLSAPAGTYRLRVDLPSRGVGYLPNLVGLDKGADIKLTSGKSETGITYRLPAVGSVSGTLLDSSAAPISGALISAQYNLVDNIVDGFPIASWRSAPGSAASNAKGAYTLPLSERTYRIEANGRGRTPTTSRASGPMRRTWRPPRTSW